MLLYVVAEGADCVARGFSCFRVGAGEEEFVLRHGVDGLIGGALDREDFVSKIGIRGDGSDCGCSESSISLRLAIFR